MVKRRSAKWVFGLLALGAMMPCAQAEDKSFVSEIAKNNVGLVVVYSGESTLPAARSLTNAVMAANPKRKTTANVGTIPAEKFTGSAPGGVTYVFMLVGDEMGEAFSPGLSAALPAQIDSPACKLGVFSSRLTSDKKNAGAFSIVIYAPDAERFAPLRDDFLGRRFGDNFRAMGEVDRVVETNKVLLFSTPEVRPAIAGWGRRRGIGDLGQGRGASKAREIRDLIEWHDLAERAQLAPEVLEDK